MNTPCRFFAQGNCRNDQACSYSHATISEVSVPVSETTLKTRQGPEIPPIPVHRAPRMEDTRKQIPCRFYASGNCLKGDVCPFAHPDANVEDGDGSNREVQASCADKVGTRPLWLYASSLSCGLMPIFFYFIQDEPEDGKSDTWIREIGGAVVQFGNGAVVVKASLQSDFSAVRINMLPPHSDQASVSKLLKTLEFDVFVEDIRVLPVGDGTHCAADVRVEDPTFAKRLCEAVTPESKIKVDAVNATMPRGSNSQRVECKKVHCSWHRPLKTVWLNFRSKREAAKVDAGFSAGTYKICDSMVKSHGVKGSHDIFNSQGLTVMLTEVPAGASKVDVSRNIPRAARPSHIEAGKPSLVYDMATANATVKSKLIEIGALDWWEGAATHGGKRAKARGRFREEGLASKAAAELNGWQLPFNTKLRLDVQAIYSARFKVPERIFKVVKPVIDAQTPSWLGKHVFLTKYDASPVNGHRVLRLEGEDKVAVAEAKGTLEKILAGQVAMNDADAIWIPAFAVNGAVFLKLKQIEEELGIAIVRNNRRSCLHLFGPTEKCKEAEESLSKIANADTSATHSIDLTAEQLIWVHPGGFGELKRTLGRKVTFDNLSTPKRILVTGTDKDGSIAFDMVANQKDVAPTDTETEDICCSICWTSAEDPITTTCGHTYCADCFERFCFAGAASSATDFSLRCAGDSSKCSQELPLSELQSHLSSRVFEKILEESFKSHVRRRPETLQYCATPDCDQIYRVSSKKVSVPATFTCPSCLMSVCTACHASHQGMSCAEYVDVKSGGYAALEETKKRLGIKDCPKCKTSIEKTEGCNHMTCGGCRTHICWKCLETFSTGGECYGHLNRAHGGVFDH